MLCIWCPQDSNKDKCQFKFPWNSMQPILLRRGIVVAPMQANVNRNLQGIETLGKGHRVTSPWARADGIHPQKTDKENQNGSCTIKKRVVAQKFRAISDTMNSNVVCADRLYEWCRQLGILGQCSCVIIFFFAWVTRSNCHTWRDPPKTNPEPQNIEVIKHKHFDPAALTLEVVTEPEHCIFVWKEMSRSKSVPLFN